MTDIALSTMEQTVEIDYMELDRIIDEEFHDDKENLIMILQAIQRQYNHLPQASLTYLSEKIGVPISLIYAVGTFYSSFSLVPKGRNIISVCLGTACHVRGGARLWERIQEILHVGARETTEDMRFTLEPVRCIGCCSLGPVVKINEDVYSRVSQENIQKVLDEYH
ncbi:MAG: NAD(P)H-dependent oxidoreductase subunit E [Thermodesulfobacteriota bacterium]|nr:NAD(P)H-dependent oxidoreductase subunit E [Thermodesulfobacteriota bacterium]